MRPTPQALKGKLKSIVRDMAHKPELFVKNPGKDFTRRRKFDFADVITLLLGMGRGSLRTEMLEVHRYAADTPTASAFIQQRDKILPLAFQFLFHEFTRSLSGMKTYNGFRLLAADGTDLHIATNPSDPDTYAQNHPEKRGFNLLHLNTLYDLYNDVYLDALVQGRRTENEHLALVRMVDRCRIPGRAILIADRGYEGYNNLAHIERKGWKYLIRIKEKSGILSGLNLPETAEFDLDIRRILTCKQAKDIQTRPELYRYLTKDAHFDFLDPHINRFYPISFRVVRFKLENGACETLITNLERDAFPPRELKKLYHLRWGIETAFRMLKYTVGLIAFHSKKAEYITQEIFAALTMFNFSRWIASHAILRPKNTRYAYQVNLASALRICRHFFLYSDIHPPDVEALILADPLPVRDGRCFPRDARPRKVVSFNCRIT